jgi:outer membrane receptor protein involved in Fe transport
MPSVRGAACVIVAAILGPALTVRAQSVSGRVTASATGQAVPSATVTVEGTALVTVTDSAGRFRFPKVAVGPQVLAVFRIGFARARVAVAVPQRGTIDNAIALATTALRMDEVRVTADANSRARGELGSASVITRDAIANQVAPSLAGVLELLPGVPLSAPGIDGVQQFALRSVPTSTGAAAQLGAFGTVIILDGVPLSNNANLQTTGPRGEIVSATNAGGGIDLRRIPAAALERVEVIRGVPSARYGDLTNGAIVIETRAGVVAPELLGRYDPRTAEASAAIGREIGRGTQSVALTADLARTRLAPGLRDANVWRATLDASHRLTRARGVGPSLTLDTRLNLFQVYRQEPEQPSIRVGRSSSDRSGGLRLSERARIGEPERRHLDVTASLERDWQVSRDQQLLLRGAQPFTDRLDEGRSIGRFVGGTYPAIVQLDGAPWTLYARVEGVLPSAHVLGTDHLLRAGAELRREWNAGPGYQFDIEFPPQVTFNGVNGFDRPRRFDAIPPQATTALYLDDRFTRTLAGGVGLDVQAGLRADVLHSGIWWTSGWRDAVLQPRLNAQLAPTSWLRLRGGWGRTSKMPTLGDLYPAPQYYDVINVNWYPPSPAERLAVLTTSIRNATNPALGYAVGEKAEAGVEIDFGARGASLSLVAFRDATIGGVAYDPEGTYLLREHFALRDSVPGSGRPPTFITPAQSVDTVPVFIDQPRNMQRVVSRGVEWTLSLPVWAAIQTRLELNGAWTVSRLTNIATYLGQFPQVTSFQLDSLQARIPYWLGTNERGERALTTARIIHHQPALGLVLTGTIQYYLRENTVLEGATDTLAWSGYVTRTGTYVPVPTAQRGDAQYRDLRRQRVGIISVPASPAPDWIFSLQVAKSVFDQGRLSFYAFNALDRVGKPATAGRGERLFPRLRFGVELTVPLGRLAVKGAG